jgi:hypothetical protein
MIGKSLSSHSTYISVNSLPPKYKDELNAIIDNVVKIHGENFGEHVKFIVALKTLLDAVLGSVTIKADVNEKALKDLVAHLASEVSGSHAKLCKLSMEQQKAAFNTVDTMESVISILEAEITMNSKKK